MNKLNTFMLFAGIFILIMALFILITAATQEIYFTIHNKNICEQNGYDGYGITNCKCYNNTIHPSGLGLDERTYSGRLDCTFLE